MGERDTTRKFDSGGEWVLHKACEYNVLKFKAEEKDGKDWADKGGIVVGVQRSPTCCNN